MKNFKEFEVKRLQDVMGGTDIVITLTNLFDGKMGNEDIKIGPAVETTT